MWRPKRPYKTDVMCIGGIVRVPALSYPNSPLNAHVKTFVPLFELFFQPFFLAGAGARAPSGLCCFEAALPRTVAPEPRASGRGEALAVDLRPPQSHAPSPPPLAPPATLLPRLFLFNFRISSLQCATLAPPTNPVNGTWNSRITSIQPCPPAQPIGL